MFFVWPKPRVPLLAIMFESKAVRFPNCHGSVASEEDSGTTNDRGKFYICCISVDASLTPVEAGPP